MTEKEKKIWDMQPQSYKDAMSRNPRSKNEDWPPKNWLAIADAKSMDEAVAARPATFAEIELEKDIRRKRGQRLTDMQSEALETGAPAERRHSAVQLFLMPITTFKDIMQQAQAKTQSVIERVRAEVFGNEK